MFSQVVQKVCASMFFLKNLATIQILYIHWQVQGDSNLPQGPTSNNYQILTAVEGDTLGYQV